MPAPAISPEDNPPRLDAARFSPGNRARLSGPALRTFLNIARAWGLSEKEKLAVLGFPPRSTFHRWVAAARKGQAPTLSVDHLLRISAVLGIYKDLRIIFGDDGTPWLRAPNAAPTFGGQRPLDLMTSGTQDGLMLVRRYLDAWRGGVFAAPTAGAPTGWAADDVVLID